MKFLNITELKSKDMPDLQKHLHALRLEYEEKHFDKRSKAAKDINEISKLKKQIAQTLTVINQLQPESTTKEEK